MVQGGQAAGTDARLNQFQSALAQQQGDLHKMVDSSSLLSTMGNFRTEFSDEFGSRFGVASGEAAQDRDLTRQQGSRAWTTRLHRGLRIGEAANPGPSSSFFITTSNPGGLRGKEPHLLDLRIGIHAVSEAQVSGMMEHRVRSTISHLARPLGRQAWTLFGHPSALRASSSWAGIWSGVATVSDYPCNSVSLDWPPEIWQSSRAQVTRHQVGGLSVLIANIYGFARGPTCLE